MIARMTPRQPLVPGVYDGPAKHGDDVGVEVLSSSSFTSPWAVADDGRHRGVGDKSPVGRGPSPAPSSRPRRARCCAADFSRDFSRSCGAPSHRLPTCCSPRPRECRLVSSRSSPVSRQRTDRGSTSGREPDVLARRSRDRRPIRRTRRVRMGWRGLASRGSCVPAPASAARWSQLEPNVLTTARRNTTSTMLTMRMSAFRVGWEGRGVGTLPTPLPRRARVAYR